MQVLATSNAIGIGFRKISALFSDGIASFKEKDLVFVQTGAHDTFTHGLAIAVSTGIRQFVESLAALAKVVQRTGFKIARTQ